MLSFLFLFLNYNKGVLYVLQFKIIIFCWDVCIPSVPPLHAAHGWDILEKSLLDIKQIHIFSSGYPVWCHSGFFPVPPVQGEKWDTAITERQTILHTYG